ncbi:MarR family winged helix-turn-helix transcriptional regulator [Kitasatospora saccharophila]|uniref:MarR family winged helix-turn-helix transcriptional regulator n=1 Tax=Kitasatospora saccharophila TaxID=407973 RepID=UPI003635221E
MSPAPDDATPERLRAVPSRLLAGAAAAADRLVNDRLAAEDARKWHFAVLVALAETGPASQSELSRRTGVYRSDMVAVLNELADAGFLVRDPDPVDRRRNVVSLTPAGRAGCSGWTPWSPPPSRNCSTRSPPPSGPSSSACSPC